MSDVLYEVDRDSGIGILTLNRPESRNAYTEAMVQGIISTLDEAEADSELRVLIITGAGPSFCAGGDLKAMQERSGMFAGDPVELRERYRLGIQGITRRFASFEKPTIAAINGAAIGAGLGLALVTDLRVASEKAKFGSTFAKVGLIPGDGSAFLLTRIIGLPRALDLLLTARIVSAEEALRMNLVHQLYAPEKVLPAAQEMAEKIAALPPNAVRAVKSLVYRTANQDLETALHLTVATQGLVQSTAEHDQAVAALLEELQRKH